MEVVEYYGMAKEALARLTEEFKELINNPVEGIIEAGPLNEKNYFEWMALIRGPQDSSFKNGIFETRLRFPKNYPQHPPRVTFVSDIFHPNVTPDGRVRIPLLRPPGVQQIDLEDPTSVVQWTPTTTIEEVLETLADILAEPDFEEETANEEAANMWLGDREQFDRIAEICVKLSLGIPTDEHIEI